MKYAVALPFGGSSISDPDWLIEFGRHAESCGFESLVVAEHSVVMQSYLSTYPYNDAGRMPIPDESAIPDPLNLLTFLAACTSTIGLATGALVLPNHHPVVLAKQAATVDVLSRGRLRLCVGVGWMREEIEACGVDFASRGRRASEQIEVMRKLWADRSPYGVDHHGEFFRFNRAMSYPKPARTTGVPVHIGGHSAAAARRAGRYGDGLQPLGVFDARLRRLVDIMRREAAQAGRDPESLELTLAHSITDITQEKAAALAELGAHRIVLQLDKTSDLEEMKDKMSACATRLEMCVV